jgi:RimJ/RimL family protein N-acetyltransferase
VLRTPRLTLRPIDDEGLYELAELALRGIHPVEEMPFLQPWTDQPPDELVRGVVQHQWAARSRLQPTNWSLGFLARCDGQVIGVQDLSARDFAITREVSTGSWLGSGYQGRGFGTEMRAAALLLAFDHLGATAARSGAYVDNPASLRVSEKLAYRRDGTDTFVRRGKAVTEIRLLLEASHFIHPEWTLVVDCLGGCRELLGAAGRS